MGPQLAPQYQQHIEELQPVEDSVVVAAADHPTLIAVRDDQVPEAIRWASDKLAAISPTR
jgi:hypothetical protein